MRAGRIGLFLIISGVQAGCGGGGGSSASPPSDLAYSSNPAVYATSIPITNNTPTSSGGAVVSYSVSPALPAGLSLDTSSGVISGTPTAVTPQATYIVTARNSGGSTTASLSITVNGTTVVRYGHPELTTVGDTSGEPFSAGYLLGQQVVVDHSIGLTQLAVNVVEAGPNVILALYSDAAGAPSDLVARTSAKLTVAGSNEIDVTAPVDLAAGTYWLMADYDTDATIANAPSSHLTCAYRSLTFGAALPDPFGSPSTGCALDNIGLYLVGTK